MTTPDSKRAIFNKGLTRSLGKLADYKAEPSIDFHMVSLGNLVPVPKLKPQPHPFTLAGSPMYSRTMKNYVDEYEEAKR